MLVRLLSVGFLLILASFLYWQFTETKQDITSIEDVTDHFPILQPISIGGVSMQASVADTQTTRTKGLSDTPFLPKDVVKLFVFESEGKWGIWMKDMNYAIDIIWADDDGIIVHIEEEVSPETFPNVFKPEQEALYVVETNAGFVKTNNIVIGDSIDI